ncbi:MAG: PEP-CTERM sorting domain-containing protein [Akkermansiaceae bacterium]|nr:PEP-CTERM sorting domain-containing protein [Akkermansiaceae bacterium]
MKKTISLLGLLAGLSVSAVAETLWVYGVSEHGGWYDADKVSSTTDLNKCWAAVSANLINWWQNQYQIPKTFDYYGTTYTIPDEDAVWAKYREKTRTVMSNVELGVDWWWSGRNTNNEFDNDSFTGSPDCWFYYTYLCMPGMGIKHKRADYLKIIEPEKTDLSVYLYQALTTNDARKGIGINVGSSQNASLHGVTMWGAEFDDNKKLTALWLTDSDDNILNKVGENGSAVDLGLFKVNVEYTDKGLYLADYWYQEASIIESITVLDAAATDAWTMERIYLTPPIPEPTTATLSLLALSAMAARRRRK